MAHGASIIDTHAGPAKKCAGPCGEVKLLGEFSKHAACAGGVRSRCKDCTSSEAAGYVKRKKENDPSWQRDRWLRQTYGIGLREYEVMLAEQSGVCAICRRPETVIWRGMLRPLAVDHDHDTGRVRGLLCANCNQGLGLFADSPDRLRSAAAYVEAHRA